MAIDLVIPDKLNGLHPLIAINRECQKSPARTGSGLYEGLLVESSCSAHPLPRNVVDIVVRAIRDDPSLGFPWWFYGDLRVIGDVHVDLE